MGLQPIIWPLKTKLFHPVFKQQRPVWNGGLPIPIKVINLPWNAIGTPELGDVSTEPRVVHQLIPLKGTFFQISGQTKDSTGAALASCVVEMINTTTDIGIEKVTSNGDGYFYFKQAVQGQTYYLVAYKAGSPDVAGTTVNTLAGT